MNDEMKPIPGAPNYFATRAGAIISAVKEPHRLLKQTPTPKYLVVQLGKAQRRYVHDLILRTFHGPPPTPEHQARFIDNNRRNLKADNLTWSTPTECAAEQVKRGTAMWLRPHRRHMKLSEAQAREVKARILQGERQLSIALEFNISQTTVSAIKRGKIWRDVQVNQEVKYDTTTDAKVAA